MAGQYFRLLDAIPLSDSKKQDRNQVLDLGAFTQLNVHVRLVKAGTGNDADAVVELEHAAVNEDDAFIPLTSASWRVDSTATGGFLQITGFLRFVRWVTGSAVAGSPAVIIEGVAKD